MKDSQRPLRKRCAVGVFGRSLLQLVSYSAALLESLGPWNTLEKTERARSTTTTKVNKIKDSSKVTCHTHD